MLTQKKKVKAPLSNSSLPINKEVMGTTEPVNTEDSIENESKRFNGRDGGINQRPLYLF